MYSELDPRCDLQPHLPRILNREVYYKGQTIISQDAEGFHAYYIEKGQVEVVIHNGQHEVKIAELGAGEIFGEMALLEDDVRSATVRALRDTTITIISASDLEQKLANVQEPAIRALMHVFINRLRAANKGQLEQYKNLADFQDCVTGLVDKTARGIDEFQRAHFRDEAAPLLRQLEDMLDKYRTV